MDLATKDRMIILKFSVVLGTEWSAEWEAYRTLWNKAKINIYSKT
jgi:hypothetical protein